MVKMAPARAALLVYHDSAAEGTQSPAGWAYAAVRTAKRLVGVLDTVLVTNRAKEPALAAGPFARVVQLDVLAAAKIKPVARRTLCGLKIFALLHGWEHGLLPEQVHWRVGWCIVACNGAHTGITVIGACTGTCTGASACTGALVLWPSFGPSRSPCPHRCCCSTSTRRCCDQGSC